MLGFIGLNLMFDENAIDASPSNVTNINYVELKNGIIDGLYVTKDISKPYTEMGEWDNNTVMRATFDNSLMAGNIDFLGQEISKILVKRREADNITADWLTLYSVDIDNKVGNLNFTVTDHYNKANTNYIYALVPLLLQEQDGVTVEVEGAPIESNVILSQFDGVFICDMNNIYKLYADVEYDTMTVNQQAEAHVTLGNKYPIVVSNSQSRYRTSGVTATVLTPSYFDDRILDRNEMVEYRKILEAFFANNKPKILKDWNGNVWMIMFTEGIDISFDNSWTQGIASISGSWTEIGDANDTNALAYAGLTNIVSVGGM